MTSLALGLAASACWATTGILMSIALRQASVHDATFWFLVVAVALTAPLGAAGALSEGIATDDVLWLALSGVASGGAMLLMNRALARGRVGTVAPLVALEGPFAICAGVLAGQRVAAAVVAGGLLATAGGVLVAFRGEPGPREGRASAAGSGPAARQAVAAGSALAVGSAALFGVSLWALAEQSGAPVLAVLLLRAFGLAVVAPTVLRSRARPPRLGLLAAAALGDVAGNLFFLAAADAGSLSVAAIAATQFGSLAALGGFLLWGERLSHRQVTGVAVLGAGIALVAATSA